MRARLVLGLLLAFAAGGAIVFFVMRRAEPSATTHQQYYCPMHPDYVSDVQGDCPVCSMRLVPLVGPKGPPSATMEPSGASTMHDGSVHIPAERQQQIGVKLATVERVPVSVTLRLPARVAMDERRIGHVHSRVTGFIEDVFVNFTGASVMMGDPLFTLYSPEMLATQQELITALHSARRLRGGPLASASQDADALAQSARRRLQLWGMSESQIDRVERTGTPIRAVTIVSPVTGVVLEREAFHHGRAVTPDLDLYMIADLSLVWVIAQLDERHVEQVHVGDEVRIELPSGRTLTTPISFISPTIDPATRSASVRMDVANQDFALKEGMLVEVIASEDMGSQLVVPPDAVIDTGDAQRAFVDLGDGYLQPRRIHAGPRVEQGRVVLDGLAEGERVIASAAFLVDAESSIRGALEGMGEPHAHAEAPPR